MKAEANVDWRGVEADMHQCWRQRPSAMEYPYPLHLSAFMRDL